ncbi:hypothetical protein EV702DRAFT_963013, partial [Suillus placidus]
ELLGLALRLGVEYIDVEISASERLITELAARRGFSQIIASWHDWSGKMKWNEDVVSRKTRSGRRFILSLRRIASEWSWKVFQVLCNNR